jgi:signal peptidase I
MKVEGAARRPGIHLTRLAREGLPAVAVGLLVCHLIRSHLLEWYLVPSRSMEPTLHGDPERGDLVLVDKTAYWLRPPRRYELVVVRDARAPEDDYLVKRAVAFGDDERCWVEVAEGDLWLGTSRQTMQIDVKRPDSAAASALRVDHFAFPEAGAAPRAEDYFAASPAWRVDRARGEIVLAPAAGSLAELAASLAGGAGELGERAAGAQLPGHLRTRLPVDTRFLDAAGELRGSFALHPDIGVELEARPGDGWSGLQVVLEFAARYWGFSVEPTGRVVLTEMGEPVAAGQRAAPCAPAAALHVRLGYLDGWFFAQLDGELVLYEKVDVPRQAPAAPAGLQHNLLHLASAGAALRIPALRVFHDVYYGAPGAALAPQRLNVPPGSMFLLGDNSRDSRDSRFGRTYAVADLVGRPLAILAPAARRRWLTP